MKKRIRGFLSILLAFGIVAFTASCDLAPKEDQTPVASDYTIGNLTQSVGSVTAVTITPKEGKSPGAVSNIKYDGSATIPQAAGTYAVTFDVAAASGWNKATGLPAGNLTVGDGISGSQTPVAGDYTFGKMSQTAGNVTAVSITAKEGKSPGTVGNIKYVGSTTVPQAAGTYAVTFDVAEASGWNSATGLVAGNLTVHQADPSSLTPIASDYTIGKLGQMAGSVTAVTIAAKEGKSPGAVSNIKYAGSATIPQAAGTYAVTFDVAAAADWNMASDLSAGNLTVNAAGDTTFPPVSGDFTFKKMNQTTEGTVGAVSIEPNTGKSNGKIGNIKYNNSTEVPKTAGTYAVTFDVEAATGWKAANGLSAGNLNIYPFTTTLTAGKVTITGYTGTGTGISVIIPAEINDNPVTAIEGVQLNQWEWQGAFKDKKLTGVIIPSSVTTIGDNAFSSNRLTSVTIPSSVKSIGNSAFSYNDLTSVTIPGSVTTIPYYAFSNNKLTSVTIPSGVTEIQQGAFSFNRLTSVTIPDTVKILGGFDHNDFTSVTIPNKVTGIAYYAFSNNALTSVTLSGDLTAIGQGAFSNNRLTSITIPSKVKYINGFDNNALTSVTIQTASTDNASVTIGDEAFWNNKLASVTIPNVVTEIGGYAFEGNPLTSVTLGANVTLGTTNELPGEPGGGIPGNTGGDDGDEPPPPPTTTTVQAFPDGLDGVYNNAPNNKAAGTYTRANLTAVWARQQQ